MNNECQLKHFRYHILFFSSDEQEKKHHQQTTLTKRHKIQSKTTTKHVPKKTAILT